MMLLHRGRMDERFVISVAKVDASAYQYIASDNALSAQVSAHSQIAIVDHLLPVEKSTPAPFFE